MERYSDAELCVILTLSACPIHASQTRLACDHQKHTASGYLFSEQQQQRHALRRGHEPLGGGSGSEMPEEVEEEASELRSGTETTGDARSETQVPAVTSATLQHFTEPRLLHWENLGMELLDF